MPAVRQCGSGQGGLTQCHPSHLSPRGCFPGSWMMVGLVDPTLWDACSQLLFGNSTDTVTNPRDTELPTPGARSLQKEVLFRQADRGASEPAQAGGVQPPLCPLTVQLSILSSSRGEIQRSCRGSVVEPGQQCRVLQEQLALANVS